MAARFRPIPSGPLFDRLNRPGLPARFARALNISHQTLVNWRARGIPAKDLPRVAAALEMSVEEYLREAGMAPLPAPVARESEPQAYLTNDERELLADYRAATGRWKLAIRHMARLRGDAEQDAAAESMTAIMAEIAATPVSDSRVETAYGLPPGRKRRKLDR